MVVRIHWDFSVPGRWALCFGHILTNSWVCLQVFPFIPSPSFWLSHHFSLSQSTENPIPLTFFASQPHGNTCYAGYWVCLWGFFYRQNIECLYIIFVLLNLLLLCEIMQILKQINFVWDLSSLNLTSDMISLIWFSVRDWIQDKTKRWESGISLGNGMWYVVIALFTSEQHHRLGKQL